MIQSITKAISVALHSEFGDGYRNYTEEVRQGLKEPCFFISCVHTAHGLFRGNQYRQENQFCIQYFPKRPGQAQEEIHAVAGRMLQCLEVISVDGHLIRGTNMEYETVDGILNFFVHYDRFVCKTMDSTAMNDCLKQISLKG